MCSYLARCKASMCYPFKESGSRTHAKYGCQNQLWLIPDARSICFCQLEAWEHSHAARHPQFFRLPRGHPFSIPSGLRAVQESLYMLTEEVSSTIVAT